MSADETAPQLSATLALRLRELDKTLRDAGLLAANAPPLWEQRDIVRTLTKWRASDYGDGREGRALSVQMPAVRQPAR